MGHYWPENDVYWITPPEARDERGLGVVYSLNQQIGERTIAEFYIKDAETCPAEVLPALISEYSMEEYIAPDLPEHVQRRILKNTWNLQSLKGYDAGVRLGLDLLGLKAEIIQWHQQVPMAEANTHIVFFSVDEFIFGEGSGHFNSRLLSAADRMINATKRFSQGTEVRLGAEVSGATYGGALQHTHIVAEASALVPNIPDLTAQAGYAVVATTHIHSNIGG